MNIATLTRDNKRLRDALAELVLLKDVHDFLDIIDCATVRELNTTYSSVTASHETFLRNLYQTRKPVAWDAARRALRWDRRDGQS